MCVPAQYKDDQIAIEIKTVYPFEDDLHLEGFSFLSSTDSQWIQRRRPPSPSDSQEYEMDTDVKAIQYSEGMTITLNGEEVELNKSNYKGTFFDV